MMPSKLIYWLMKRTAYLCLAFLFGLALWSFALIWFKPIVLADEQSLAKEVNQESLKDFDNDGLADSDELKIYKTDPFNLDTDGDGYMDGTEIKMNTDPKAPFEYSQMEKLIVVSLARQNLRYYIGPYILGQYKVSTGLPGFDTPTGEFTIRKKLPTHTYRGEDYYYPDTKWNLLFLPGRPGENVFIHGAYWHNRFGQKASHGCVNMAYKDVEVLYGWADIGTKVSIQ